ncbi:MAG: sporulation protein YhbH [Bacillota bacterium]
MEFTVSREDWTLHRKGEIDARRHQEKVREAIRKKLPEIITEESIILTNGRKIVKIPIRSLEEYRFRFDHNKMLHVGQGDGNTKVGDRILPGKAHGKGKGVGEEPGIDYYEAEVTVEEIADIVFEELSLPHLEPRRKPRMMCDAREFSDIRKTGLSTNIDRKRTLLTVLRRNAIKGSPGFDGIRPEDLRFRTWNIRRSPESSAVVLAMMDTSGSMGPFEKYIARCFFFWTVRFLRVNYHNVEMVFLSHHTEAQETTEEEFFCKGESGGTKCSAVYKLALEIIAERYPPSDYNIYAFHFSDGDNLTTDNDSCVKLVGELLKVANLVGYGEIEGPYYYTSTLKTAYRVINHPRFVMSTLRDKGDIYKTLKTFFAKERG